MHDTDRFSRPQVSFADLTPTTAPTWSTPTVPTLPTLRPAGAVGGKRLAHGTVPPLPALSPRPPILIVQERPDAPALPIRVVPSRQWGHVEKVRLDGDVKGAPARVARRHVGAGPRILVTVLAIAILALIAVLSTSRPNARTSTSVATVRSRPLSSAASPAAMAPPVVITALPELEPEPVIEQAIDQAIEMDSPPRVTAVPWTARARPTVPVASAPTRSTADLDGVLAVGAKPPCRIIVDGRDTGLMTPQRELRLPAGSHEIILINREYGVEDRSTVMIDAGTTTKLVRDLSAHLGS